MYLLKARRFMEMKPQNPKLDEEERFGDQILMQLIDQNSRVCQLAY